MIRPVTGATSGNGAATWLVRFSSRFRAHHHDRFWRRARILNWQNSAPAELTSSCQPSTSTKSMILKEAERNWLADTTIIIPSAIQAAGDHQVDNPERNKECGKTNLEGGFPARW